MGVAESYKRLERGQLANLFRDGGSMVRLTASELAPLCAGLQTLPPAKLHACFPLSAPHRETCYTATMARPPLSVRDLRLHWPAAERRLKREGELVVTRDGEPVAKLIAYRPEKRGVYGGSDCPKSLAPQHCAVPSMRLRSVRLASATGPRRPSNRPRLRHSRHTTASRRGSPACTACPAHRGPRRKTRPNRLRCRRRRARKSGRPRCSPV